MTVLLKMRNPAGVETLLVSQPVTPGIVQLGFHVRAPRLAERVLDLGREMTEASTDLLELVEALRDRQEAMGFTSAGDAAIV